MIGAMPALTLSPDQHFDLHSTLACGQAFRWTVSGGWWQGIVAGRLIRVQQEGRKFSGGPVRTGHLSGTISRWTLSSAGFWMRSTGIRSSRRQSNDAAGSGSCVSRHGNASPRTYAPRTPISRESGIRSPHSQGSSGKKEVTRGASTSLFRRLFPSPLPGTAASRSAGSGTGLPTCAIPQGGLRTTSHGRSGSHCCRTSGHGGS